MTTEQKRVPYGSEAYLEGTDMVAEDQAAERAEEEYLGAAPGRGRSILEELRPYGLNETLLQRANGVYQELQPRTIKRGNRRLLHLHCVHQAYLRLGHRIALQEVAREMKIGLTDQRKTSKSFSSRRIGRAAKINIVFETDHYIRRHLDLFTWGERGDDYKLRAEVEAAALAYYEQLKSRAPELLQGCPERLAMVLIQLCLTDFGVGYRQADTAKAIETSAVTVRKLFNQVTAILWPPGVART